MGLFKNIANAVKDVADVVNDVATPVVDAVTGGLGSKQQDFIDGIFDKVVGNGGSGGVQSGTPSVETLKGSPYYTQAISIIRSNIRGIQYAGYITSDRAYYKVIELIEALENGADYYDLKENFDREPANMPTSNTSTSKGGVLGSLVDKGNKWLDNTLGKVTGTLSKNGENVLNNSIDGYFKKNWAKVLAFIAGTGLVIGLAIKAVSGSKKNKGSLW